MRCPRLNELPSAPSGKSGWPWTKESAQLPCAMPDGSQWPQISVVTPSYNQGQFIEETIRSVLLQGYPDLEYIIIDGSSTDDSAEIIRKYEPWLAYWVSEPDNGQSDAINKGFRLTTGEIVGWLNSDDVYEPDTLGTRVRDFSEQPEADLTYNDYNVIDEHSRKVSTVPAPPFDPVRLFLQDFVAQPTVLIQRRVIERVGLLDVSLQCVMDYEYWLRATTKGFCIARVSGCTANFRQHKSAKSTVDEVRFWFEMARVFDKLFSAPRLAPELRQVESRARARLHWNAALSCEAAGRMAEARTHSELAVDTYGLIRNPEELGYAVYRALRDSRGRLLLPNQTRSRLQRLDSGSASFAVLQKKVEERYGIASLLQAVRRRLIRSAEPRQA